MAAEPLRAEVPEARVAVEAERDVPGAAARVTLVRPVLERREVPREAAEPARKPWVRNAAERQRGTRGLPRHPPETRQSAEMLR